MFNARNLGHVRQLPPRPFFQQSFPNNLQSQNQNLINQNNNLRKEMTSIRAELTKVEKQEKVVEKGLFNQIQKLNQEILVEKKTMDKYFKREMIVGVIAILSVVFLGVYLYNRK